MSAGGEPRRQETASSTQPRYLGAPSPVDEAVRHRSLVLLDVLDTGPEERFDAITRLCRRLLEVPIVLISLVDRERQWMKSSEGLAQQQIDRNSSFAAWLLLPINPEVLVVPDMEKDARFCNNPMVRGHPFVRFYAAAPLVLSNGQRAGSLCIIDRQPQRNMSRQQAMLLANIAELVVRELERACMLKLVKNPSKPHPLKTLPPRALQRSPAASQQALMLVDAQQPGWPILYCNASCCRMLEVSGTASMEGQLFWDVFHARASSIKGGDAELQRGQLWWPCVREGEPFAMEAFCFLPGHCKQWLAISARCCTSGLLDPLMPLPYVSFELPQQQMEHHIYCMALQERTQDHPPQQVLSRVMRLASQTLEAWQSSPLKHHLFCPLLGVRLGQLLSKNAYSRVYRAVCVGRRVVKVTESTEPGPRIRSAMDLITSLPPHENLVAVERWALTECEGSRTSASTGAWSQSSLGGEEPESWEVWMLLEDWNRGPLSRAVLAPTDSAERPDPVMQRWCSSLRDILRTALEVARALEQLHSCNLVHGNLHLNNVMLRHCPDDERGFQAAVSDYGLYWLLDPPLFEDEWDNASEGDASDEVYGQHHFLSPQIHAEGPCARRKQVDDVYALGVVMEVLAEHWRNAGQQEPARRQPGASGQQGAEAQDKVLGVYNQLVALCKEDEPCCRPSASELVSKLSLLLR